MTLEHKRKIGKANAISLKGKHISPETEFKKGHKINIGKKNGNWKNGITNKKCYCIDCNKKLSRGAYIEKTKRCNKCWKKFNRGINHTSYIIGIDREYPIEFKSIRLKIRKRDNYICICCKKYGNEVHHINYNKQNCQESNLITLCSKCHRKTNFNRDYWYAYFTYLTEK